MSDILVRPSATLLAHFKEIGQPAGEEFLLDEDLLNAQIAREKAEKPNETEDEAVDRAVFHLIWQRYCLPDPLKGAKGDSVERVNGNRIVETAEIAKKVNGEQLPQVISGLGDVKSAVEALHGEIVRCEGSDESRADELVRALDENFSELMGKLVYFSDREQEWRFDFASKLWKFGYAIILLLIALILTCFFAPRAHAQQTIDGIRVKEAGTLKGTVAGGFAVLNFNSGCTITKTGNEFTITCSGGTYNQTIQDEGTPLTQRTALNFAGAGISCADDTTKTTCTVAGGGSTTFDLVGAGTNANALVVGTGGSLSVSGSGTIAATTSADAIAHALLTTAHGSTSANTASRIVQRGASGEFAAGKATLTNIEVGPLTGYTGSNLYPDLTGAAGSVFGCKSLTTDPVFVNPCKVIQLQYGGAFSAAALLVYADNTGGAKSIFNGAEYDAFHSSADAVGDLNGGYYSASFTGGGGAVTNAWALRGVMYPGATPNAINIGGLLVEPGTCPATGCVNHYGLKVNDAVGGTNVWGVWAGRGKHWFGDRMIIGPLDASANTGFTVNLPTGHTGKALSLQLNSVEKASADKDGNITAASFIGPLTGTASLATALAANPTDCGVGEFANAIAANGNLTCAVPASGGAPTNAQYLTLATDATLTVERVLTAGAGIAGTDAGAGSTYTIATASDEADFLKSGALTCGASTQGKMQVHTTPLQYCDNAATPALQYAAYGDSSGNATTGDSATAFFTTGQIEAARGGTGIDTSGSTGVLRVSAGTWTANAGISHLAASTSSDLAGVLSNETGSGLAVFDTNPTFSSYVVDTAIAAPGTPAAGLAREYVDSTRKRLTVIDDAGEKKGAYGFWQLISADSGSFNPLDSTSYCEGANWNNRQTTCTGTTYNRVKIKVLQACTVKRAYYKMVTQGTLSSAEDVTLAIRVNDTSDIGATTTQIDGSAEIQDALVTLAEGTANASLAEGDYVALKITTPAWVTNPTSVLFYGSFYCE